MTSAHPLEGVIVNTNIITNITNIIKLEIP